MNLKEAKKVSNLLWTIEELDRIIKARVIGDELDENILLLVRLMCEFEIKYKNKHGGKTILSETIQKHYNDMKKCLKDIKKQAEDELSQYH